MNNTCPRCGKWAGAHATLPGQSKDHLCMCQPVVKQPTWQPIATAPKDVQLLLATEFDGPGDWRIKMGYFYSETGQWTVWGASWTPTHWMPVPNPPGETV